MIITSDQIRAARALKNWSQADLAGKVGMATPSIGNIEAGKHTPTRQTQEAIWQAFEEAGIEFIEGGVRKKQDLIQVYEGEDSYLKLLDDIFRVLSPIKGEVLFSGSDERKSPAQVIEKLRAMRRSGIRMRSLVRAGNEWLMGPLDEYRWISDALYVESDVKVIFKDFIAYAISWKGTLKVIVIHDEMICSEARRTFEYVWKSSDKPTLSNAETRYDE